MYFSKVFATVALAIGVATAAAVPDANAEANAVAAQAKRGADLAHVIFKREADAANAISQRNCYNCGYAGLCQDGACSWFGEPYYAYGCSRSC